MDISQQINGELAQGADDGTSRVSQQGQSKVQPEK